ncbi:diacylglycerol kinase, catalytic domain-containing protein [Artemisia annua]|uniref:sphingosine kinase n=1 Tax=Artemisia annua TaxID=35608 RepID=A0A2U1M4X8_ARTAN|nr:diacylglycerol kinase, catalytic domain-containing protein [Artemisia annua]
MNQHIIFSDEVLVNGYKTALTLSTDGILRWHDTNNVLHSLSIEEQFLGVSNAGQHVIVKSFVKEDGFCFGSCLVRKTFVFEPFSPHSLRILFDNIQSYIHSLGRPKRLFIFVNPFGGKKSASKVFANDVRPILEDANIEYTLQETKYQLHAKEVSHTLDLTNYDGIICVSGDGILVEVVNGLLEREDWQAALKMPIGVIPAGTGNGMIKSLLDSVGQPCTAAYAMLAAVRGHKRSLDVATIWQGETRFFSVLMLAWGLIADIDIESEKYRWMGSARMDIYGLQRALKLRKYNGCISFVPAPGFEDVGEPISLGVVESMEPLKAPQHSYQGPKVDFPSSCWRKLNGPFIGVWLQNVPWGSETAKAAPNAKFDDGYLDLILMRECPKLALLSLMSEMSNGNYVRSPHVLYIKVSHVDVSASHMLNYMWKGVCEYTHFVLFDD